MSADRDHQRQRDRQQDQLRGDRPLHVLGFVVSDHNSAAALLRDGELVAAIGEERLCRVRHGDPANVVRRSIEYVLAEGGITLADLDALVSDTACYYPDDRRPRPVLPDLDDPSRHYVLDHHVGHVASAFLPGPFDEAAILSLDASGGLPPLMPDRAHWGLMPHDEELRNRGFVAAHRNPIFDEVLAARPPGGSWAPAESIVLAHGVRGKPIVELQDQMVGGSLGYFYALCARFVGLEEGTFMGMSSFGGPSEMVPIFEEIVRLEEGGRVRIDPAWMRFCEGDYTLPAPASLERLTQRWFDAFGEPTDPYDPRRTLRERDTALAWAAQRRLEQAIVHIARHLHDLSGSRNICLAGGVALNGLANSAILRETAFENIFVQPAASDDGLALGYAMFADYVLTGLPAEPRWRMSLAATGHSYSEREIGEAVAAVQGGRLELEYLAPRAGTVAVDVIWSVGGGESSGRTPMIYLPGVGRWRAAIPVPPPGQGEVRYCFEGRCPPVQELGGEGEAEEEQRASCVTRNHE